MKKTTRDTCVVILFFSTGHALKAEKALQKAGISCKLIPVPRHLSSDCGVCLRVVREDKQAAVATLLTEEIETEGTHNLA